MAEKIRDITFFICAAFKLPGAVGLRDTYSHSMKKNVIIFGGSISCWGVIQGLKKVI